MLNITSAFRHAASYLILMYLSSLFCELLLVPGQELDNRRHAFSGARSIEPFALPLNKQIRT